MKLISKDLFSWHRSFLQIIAEFEEGYSPLPQLNCGDVTSTSSVCTGSPDLFSVEVGSHCSIPYNPSDVEITEDPHPLGKDINFF